MEFFKRNTNFPFLGISKITTVISFVMVFASLILIFTKGIRLGLDFTGGYSVKINFSKQIDFSNLKNELKKEGLVANSIVKFGQGNNYKIIFGVTDNKKILKNHNNKIIIDRLIKKSLKGSSLKYNISNFTYLGPSVGAALLNKGILALITSFIVMMLYIAFRFDFKFAFSAVVALAHDPIIIMGVISLFGLEFDLTALAGLLAVIGYSLNDTVVIYDRIRENMKKNKNESAYSVINKSINETLSRTIMTSLLTLIVVTVLFFFGGPTIHVFSLALVVGIIVGTYSSIYVAGALSWKMGVNSKSFISSEGV